MPEGDTIFRAARSLRAWLGGRVVTGAEARGPAFDAGVLVGRRVDAVEATGKHLLVRFSGGAVLHTHMRMNGSWHVYSAGERWRRPVASARFVLEAGDRIAVVFDAPVVRLLDEREAAAAVGHLGPDVLDPRFDAPDAAARVRASAPPAMTIGEALLDQRLVAGIGNIWRSEALFAERVHPMIGVADLGADVITRVLAAASRLMTAAATATRPRAAVYRRSGRPCPRCRTAIESARLGDEARSVYWCPRCQPAGAAPATASG